MRSAERTPSRALAVTLFCLALAAGDPSAAPAEELTSIILRVNDEIATLHEYRERKQARLAAIAEVAGVPQEEKRHYIDEAPRATMREILDELLLVSRARQLVIEPSRGEIDDAVDNMRQRLGFESEAALLSALEASDMSMAEYRDRTGRQLKASQVIQREVNPRVRVEDEWLQRYYREHQDEFRIPARLRLRELVLPEETIPAAEATGLAAEIRATLAAGEEMAAAASRLGGDRIVGPVDLGWVEPGELAGPLDAAVWGLPPGALSEPIAARGGLHLVEVLERVESSLRPYVEVKAEIEARERNRRHDDVLREYLAELERSAYLIERIPVEAAGFRDTGLIEKADPLAAFAPKRETPGGAPAEMERIPEASAPGAPPPGQ